MADRGGTRHGRWLEGEILGEDEPGPNEPRRPGPGWIGRNRGFIEQGKTLAQTALVLSPPPARLALAALSVAADGLLLAEDLRSGRIDAHAARLRAGGIALEGVALFAATRLAPAILARNQVRMRQMRRILSGMEAAARPRAG